MRHKKTKTFFAPKTRFSLSLSRKASLMILVLSSVMLFSCGETDYSLITGDINENSKTVVNIPHTSIKKQILGTCWIYSTVAMVESLVLKESQGLMHEDFSEAYLTYMHLKELLLPSYGTVPKVLDDAGNFARARKLIKRYGLLREQDFIKNDANKIEKEAFIEANRSLKEGPLKELFSFTLSLEEKKQLVFSELNRIFGVDIDQKMKYAISAKDIIITSAKTGEKVTLEEELDNWEDFPFKSVYDFGPDYEDINLNKQISLTENQQHLLKRLKQLLNKGYPAALSWFVDNHAHQNGSFRIQYLKEKGSPGQLQGGHISVIEDYTAILGYQYLGAGELSQQEKELALEGKLESIIVKNSWGNDSSTSIAIDGEYGYNRIFMDYLLTWIPLYHAKKATLPLISMTLPKE